MQSRHVATAALAMLVAGCGSATPGSAAPSDRPTASPAFASLTGRQIAQEALADMHVLESFRLRLQQSDDTADLVADFHVDRLKRCSGTVGVGDGVRVRVISTHDGTYQFGDKRYWSQDAENGDEDFVEAASGRWVKTPMIPQYAALCDLDQLFPLPGPGKADAALDDALVDTTTTAEGQTAIRVTMGLGERQSVMLVSPSEPHRILSFSRGDTFRITFSNFDGMNRIDVPEEGDYVDFAKLPH